MLDLIQLTQLDQLKYLIPIQVEDQELLMYHIQLQEFCLNQLFWEPQLSLLLLDIHCQWLLKDTHLQLLWLLQVALSKPLPLLE